MTVDTQPPGTPDVQTSVTSDVQTAVTPPGSPVDSEQAESQIASQDNGAPASPVDSEQADTQIASQDNGAPVSPVDSEQAESRASPVTPPTKPPESLAGSPADSQPLEEALDEFTPIKPAKSTVTVTKSTSSVADTPKIKIEPGVTPGGPLTKDVELDAVDMVAKTHAASFKGVFECVCVCVFFLMCESFLLPGVPVFECCNFCLACADVPLSKRLQAFMKGQNRHGTETSRSKVPSLVDLTEAEVTGSLEQLGNLCSFWRKENQEKLFERQQKVLKKSLSASAGGKSKSTKSKSTTKTVSKSKSLSKPKSKSKSTTKTVSKPASEPASKPMPQPKPKPRTKRAGRSKSKPKAHSESESEPKRRRVRKVVSESEWEESAESESSEKSVDRGPSEDEGISDEGGQASGAAPRTDTSVFLSPKYKELRIGDTVAMYGGDDTNGFSEENIWLGIIKHKNTTKQRYGVIQLAYYLKPTIDGLYIGGWEENTDPEYVGLFIKFPEVHAKVCWTNRTLPHMCAQAWARLSDGIQGSGT